MNSFDQILDTCKSITIHVNQQCTHDKNHSSKWYAWHEEKYDTHVWEHFMQIQIAIRDAVWINIPVRLLVELEQSFRRNIVAKLK